MTADYRPAQLITSDSLARLDVNTRYVRKQHASEDVVRIRVGAYYPTADWRQLNNRERHLLKMFAYAERNPEAVFSHQSAAAVHQLPLIGNWPEQMHISINQRGGGNARGNLVRHCRHIPVEHVERRGELWVTDALLTVCDLAESTPFRHAVVPADAALRRELFSATALDEFFPQITARRSFRRIRTAVTFADGRSESPGESLSRALIHELGFPRPELQTRHRRPGGGYDVTDFEWPEHALIGEFDGRAKYERDEYRAGRTPGEVVFDEKVREDRLRAQGKTVARWIWSDLMPPTGLRATLLTKGLPLRR